MSSARPNFVVILTDSQRRDSLGCYGNSAIRTPNLDRLSSEGVRFDRAFVANMICGPSRASFWTGRYPRCHGVVTNGVPLPDTEITMADALRAAGYRTAAVGTLNLSPQGDTPENDTPESARVNRAGRRFPVPYHGFEQVRIVTSHTADWGDYHRFLTHQSPELLGLYSPDKALQPPSGAPSSWKCAMPEEYHCTTWIADQAIDQLRALAEGEQQFLLSIGFIDPHFPFCPPRPWCEMYDPKTVPMPHRNHEEISAKTQQYQFKIDRFAKAWGYHPVDMPEHYIREIIAHYYGMVSMVDHNIGRILEALDQLELTDQTVVIFSTDHGEHLGDHWLIYKAAPFDECTHVPLIWRWPQRFDSGRCVEGLVSHIDVMPTVLDLAEVGPPGGIQGQSYAAALQGKPFDGRSYVLCEDDDLSYGVNRDGWLRTLRTQKHRISYYLPQQNGELYDLECDPHEFRNLWDDPDYADVRRQLLNQMLDAVIYASDPAPRRVAPY